MKQLAMLQKVQKKDSIDNIPGLQQPQIIDKTRQKAYGMIYLPPGGKSNLLNWPNHQLQNRQLEHRNQLESTERDKTFQNEVLIEAGERLHTEELIPNNLSFQHERSVSFSLSAKKHQVQSKPKFSPT